MKRKLVTLADLVVAAVAVALSVAALLLLMPRGQGKNAVVFHKGKRVATMPLNKDGEFSVSGVTVTVEKGQVYVSHSDCPDKICMNSRLKQSGDITVCMPNSVSVVIDGEDERDGITY